MEDELANYAQSNAQDFWRDAGEMHLNRGFPLTSSSKVIDVGGYKGDWTAFITRMHNCYVDIYEPLEDYCIAMRARFAGNPKIKVINAALDGYDGHHYIAFMEDSSSLYYPYRDDAIQVPVMNASLAVNGMVDLLALNCEGSEYAILDVLIRSGKISQIRNLLVQFHTFVPDAKAKRDGLIESLWNTHQQRWCYPFVWEAWSLTYRPNE